jgi:hypothetical protein
MEHPPLLEKFKHDRKPKRLIRLLSSPLMTDAVEKGRFVNMLSCGARSSLLVLAFYLLNDCRLERKHPLKLSITHNFRPQVGAQLDVSEARQSAPHYCIARRRVAGSGQIAPEPCDFNQVVR